MTSKAGLVATLADDLEAGHTYRFGSAWKAKKARAAILPILHTAPTADRGYRTSAEVLSADPTSIQVKDSGNIGRLSVTNLSGHRVFIPGGTVFKGVQTQSRALQFGVVLAPGAQAGIEVNCVHASHAIRPQAKHEASLLMASKDIAVGLRRRDQSRVWAEVEQDMMLKKARVTRSLARSEPLALRTAEFQAFASGLEDNFAGGYAAGRKFDRVLDEVLQEIPAASNEVGCIVFDSRGVVGVELYDSPESWNSVRKAALEQYAEVLAADEPEVFDVRLDDSKLGALALSFVRDLVSGQSQEDLIAADFGTTSYETLHAVGEATAVGGTLIHFVGYRDDRTVPD